MKYVSGYFEEDIFEYLEWVKFTFPGETPEEQYLHLKEEVNELGEDLTKADEFADVLMLLFAIANGKNVDLFEAFREKFKINQQRKWINTENGIRHVK